MKNILIAFVIGALIACGGTYIHLKKQMDSKVTQINTALGGYTKYSDYLIAGKKHLSGQTKFLGGIVTRKDTFSRDIDRRIFTFIPSSATVLITYTGKYAFGYDLSANNYEIVSNGAGIKIILANKPILLTEPSILNKSHYFPNRSWNINESDETLILYEGVLDQHAKEQGLILAKDEEVIALCERNLVTFFKDFLEKQPGVKFVPSIIISYKNPT